MKRKPAKKPASSFTKIETLSKKKKLTKAEIKTGLNLINKERELFRPITPKKKQRKKDLDRIEKRLIELTDKNKKQYTHTVKKKPKADIFRFTFKKGRKTITQIEDTLKVMDLSKIDLGYEWAKIVFVFRNGNKTGALTYVKFFSSIANLRKRLLKMFNDIKHGDRSNKKYMQRVNEMVNYLTDIIIDYETAT